MKKFIIKEITECYLVRVHCDRIEASRNEELNQNTVWNLPDFMLSNLYLLRTNKVWNQRVYIDTQLNNSILH